MNNMTELLPHIKLRFNIQYPSFEECYAYGYECALAEIGEEMNPYSLDSKESEQWLDGWWAGFYGDKPLYELLDNMDNSTNTSPIEAANDRIDHETLGCFLAKVMEITGMLAVTAAVGYQLIDLVA